MSPALLFDFNGVILDDEPQHCAALIRTLGEIGVPLDRATYYRDYLGLDDRSCVRSALINAGRRVEESALEVLVARKHACWEAEIRRGASLVPGVEQFIRTAGQEGFGLAVVSGAARSEVEMILADRQLADAFSVVVAAEDVPAGKPDPVGYRKGLALLGVSPEDAIAFEDSLPGREAARGAGMWCVMLATSHPASLLGGGDAVWSDFRDHHPSELGARA